MQEKDSIAFNTPSTVPLWSLNVIKENPRFSSCLATLLASSAAPKIAVLFGVLGWLTTSGSVVMFLDGIGFGCLEEDIYCWDV